MDNACPHDGHLPLCGFRTSLMDFSIFMLTMTFPHLPHVTSTDMMLIRMAELLRNGFNFFNKNNKKNYCFLIRIPRWSKPTILALVPTRRSSGVATPSIKPEILKSELSS